LKIGGVFITQYDGRVLNRDVVETINAFKNESFQRLNNIALAGGSSEARNESLDITLK
jgi:hypothetical protein